MEVRKVLRKATAIAASASFIGATMLGAVAQDLASYPAPFVKDGVFDAFIVVGADAQPADVVGAVDVGASLQFALKKATTSGTATEATIDAGVKIQKSGNKMNYGENVSSILDGTSITEEDLPTVMADGKYVESQGDNRNSETYTQELRFNSENTAVLEFAQDDDDAPNADNYLLVTKNDELYNYTLEFDSSIDYNNESDTTANDDLKTTTLQIQGKTYTITNVQLTSGTIDKLTLLSGEAVLWITQNNPITKTVSGVEHKVEVLDVTEDADACQIKVDDVTAIVDVDETKTINGVQVGVTDVRAIHAQLQDTDVCQISLGASEIVLQNDDEVKVDDKELDGTKCVIESQRVGALDSITVTYQPKDLSGTVYLAAGKAYTDPVFNSWKLVFGGVTAEYETYSVKTSGDNDATIKFINNDGKEVSIPVFLNDTTATAGRSVFLGDGNDWEDRVYTAGTHINASGISVCRGITSVEDCEGMMILATTSGGEAHMLEITDFNTDDNHTDIKDLTYGKTYEDVDYIDGDNTTLDLGSFGNTVILNVTEKYNRSTVVSAVSTKIETKAGGSVDIRTNLKKANLTVEFSELNKDSETDIGDEAALPHANVNVTLQPDSDAELTLVAGGNYLYTVDEKEDSDYDVKVTRVGTKVTEDDENGDSVVVQMPNAEVYGNVFVAPIVAQVSTTTSGVATYSLSKLNVGAAKLDSEISDATANNLIVVGGPCANKIAAQVLGKTYPACGTDSGIAANTALIQEVAQTGGKVALVVAGWEAVDTKRATRVLANYDAYKAQLTGSKVIVTGTSLTDITVSKSA